MNSPYLLVLRTRGLPQSGHISPVCTGQSLAQVRRRRGKGCRVRRKIVDAQARESCVESLDFDDRRMSRNRIESMEEVCFQRSLVLPLRQPGQMVWLPVAVKRETGVFKTSIKLPCSSARSWNGKRSRPDSAKQADYNG